MIRQKPLELRRLEILKDRLDRLPNEDYHHLVVLQRGYEGELWLDQVVGETLGTGAYYWPDFSFDYRGYNQVDSLLLSGDTIFLIEIKNYSTALSYDQGKWRMKGETLAKNFFVQMVETHDKISALLASNFPQIRIQPVLLFVNENTYPEIKGDPTYPVLLRHQIRPWLDQVKTPSIDSQKVFDYLREFYVESLGPPYLKASSTYPSLKSGIVCPNCGSFYTTESHQQYHCSNHHREFKRSAILRTINEYALVYRDRDLRRDEISEFCGEIAEKRLIQSCLRRNFKRLSGGLRTDFYNPYKK